MAIDACALIKPSITETRIHSGDDVIRLTKSKKVRKIEAKRCVSIVIATNKAAIHKHKNVAKCSVEFHPDTAPTIRRRNIEGPPIPSDARFGISPAKRLESVRSKFVVANKRQFHGPVVRQIQCAPFRVVEFSLRKLELSGLCEISLPVAETEVLGRICAIAKRELPTGVEEQMFARCNCGKGSSRSSARIS